jgi:murein DD-endopeptidase MepM/ murein hydrolase activator NlpD
MGLASNDPIRATRSLRAPLPTPPNVHLPPIPAAKDIEQFGRRHRLALVISLVALLGGSGLTAVAVAPLAPDAALLPQRLVTETVRLPDLQPQLEALAVLDTPLTRNEVTRGTDTAEALLARLGVRDASAVQFMRTDYTARKLLAGRGGKMVQARTGADGMLQELVARYPADTPEQATTHFNRITVLRGEGGRLVATQSVARYGAQTRLASGTIRNTLFGATDESGIPDSVAAQLADIFSTDIDFHRELRKGDTFSILYESLTADGEPVVWNEGAGRVLAAEFVNAGRAHHAVWFAQNEQRGAYFDASGRSKRRAFLASPMEFSRVTSGFAMRFHPLMQKWRAHLGVDYGAPSGTPVRVVGDGVVEFAGWQNGYGNVVIVSHGNAKSTLYAHLSRRDVKVGQRLQQGQRVGAVGMTGWSTGPHLHFEFRVNGQHQDPLRVAKSSETVPLDAAARPRFAELVQSVQAGLQVAASLSGQRARVE